MSARRRLTGLGILGLILVAGLASTPAQTLKIGVFDAQKIFEETAAGAKVQARLNALEESKRKELETSQNALKALQQQLLQTGASLSADKLRDLRLKIDRKSIELEGMQKSASREFQIEVEQAQTQWQRRIIDLVAKYGKDNGYSLIVPIGVVAYHSATTDITSELIKLVDAAGGAAAGS